ncbi:hypothetical protein L484_021461 [Morus notabilis]|uniref:Pentatricopeptide repeat-containing protein n=1 Tax=Morus notabilis TaxID=981085 RepID=W9T0A0_9ROSA|nr:pentatricopeptide repeat-containing protein At2g46050, mitochondrial [Morus notabilis]EXC35099.1 hypothetical protein L484_021461 [Morus notabilis]
MLSQRRSSSISSVHFKRLLAFPLFRPFSTKTITNGSKEADPSHQSVTTRPLSRLRALIPVHESAHFHNSHLAHSLCSKALKISAKMGFLSEGKQLHGHLLKFGLYIDMFLQNQILNFYVRCKELSDGHKVLGEMTVRNVVAWNAVICGVVDDRSYFKSSFSLGFSYFKRMLRETVHPDEITLNVLLRACIALNDVEVALQLHCFVLKLGFASNCFVSAAVVELYEKCGLVEDARCAFDIVVYRDLVLWNVMVYCYASNCLVWEAIRVFEFMRLEGVEGDDFTFCSLLSLCGSSGSYELGKQIHGIIIKHSFDIDVIVASSLIDMYSKNENIGAAHKVFDMMSIKNVVSWNTIIVGYGQHGEGKGAIKLFGKMLRCGFSPDNLTMASVVSSCGKVGLSSALMQVHACAIKFGFKSFLSTVNALINAYSKCGSIVSAFQCFSLVTEPDLFTWTSIICAYAFHGLAEGAIEYFEKMLTCGIKPDRITFLGVLSACSHRGLIDKGLRYFEMMTKNYQILPEPEHYTSLIDLVGRAGLLEEAFTILSAIPTEAGPNTFGAFLGACKRHGDLRLTEWAAEKLFTLEPSVAVNYTIMSNAYSHEGRWLDVARIRKMMRSNCSLKSPGCSWVEICGDVHTFVSSDQSHPKAVEVYDMLGLLFRDGFGKFTNSCGRIYPLTSLLELEFFSVF